MFLICIARESCFLCVQIVDEKLFIIPAQKKLSILIGK